LPAITNCSFGIPDRNSFEPVLILRRRTSVRAVPVSPNQTGKWHMRRSILIALALLSGMSSAWANNDSFALKPHGHSGAATVRHAACAVKIDDSDRSAVKAGNIGGLLSLAGELRREAACMRAHGLVAASRRSPSAKEIDDAARDADQQRLLSEQWQREESN
jgi:hypothetical protein